MVIPALVACYLDPFDLCRPYIVSSPSCCLSLVSRANLSSSLPAKQSVVGLFTANCLLLQGQDGFTWSLRPSHRTHSLDRATTPFSNAFDSGHYSIILSTANFFICDGPQIYHHVQHQRTKHLCDVPAVSPPPTTLLLWKDV
jgi:hypothetical protein